MSEEELARIRSTPSRMARSLDQLDVCAMAGRIRQPGVESEQRGRKDLG